jgi:hypothetical protein
MSRFRKQDKEDNCSAGSLLDFQVSLAFQTRMAARIYENIPP